MHNIDSIKHVKGESIYIDDLPIHEGTLYALAIVSPIAHGIIKKLELKKVVESKDVVKVLTYNDIPGNNQIGMIIQDEPLFAEKEVHFIGQPIALIIAKSEKAAKRASKLVEFDFEQKSVVTCPREAYKKGLLISAPRSFRLGSAEEELKKCKYVFKGKVDSGGQEHLYLETQGAYAYADEKGSIKIYSATQGPTAVQKIASRVLGLPMHQIEVDVKRIGGGFGGKEDQATPWAVMTALAAHITKKPVKYCLERSDDLKCTGKRHPYSSDFIIGLDENFKIKAFIADYYQNAGAAADLSPAIVERTLFHGTNAYYIPNVKLTAYSCKTNLPPNTAFRGFGAPQGVFVIESALAYAAHQLNVDKSEIQYVNLIKTDDIFPYGQKVKKANAIKSWNQLNESFEIKKIRKELEVFNQSNKHYKKGWSIMPICFGISFTNTVMNHARALVHIYQDGSIGISTGAVEMGQSVNTKLVQIAQSAFSVDATKIKIESTNTTRVANTSPSAASSTADLNGKALENACNILYDRLIEQAAIILRTSRDKIKLQNEHIWEGGKKTQLTWDSLIEKSFLARVNLSSVGHYSTPKIHFDKQKEKGHPFAYHVYGTALIVATVDCIRGVSDIDAVKIVHDFGESINLNIDKGQVEGALLQSIGWATMEELVQDKNGQLLTNALSNYKIPDIYSLPDSIEIEPLKTSGHKMAIKKSKAVGEPPFIYGIGAYFAIQKAVENFSNDLAPEYNLPFTPEKILKSLYLKNL